MSTNTMTNITKKDYNLCGRMAVGYPIPTQWVDLLFEKYKDKSVVENILLSRTTKEIYEEIKQQ